MDDMKLPRGLAPVTELDEGWRTPLHGRRLRAIRVGAEKLRARFASGPRVVSARTFDQITSPYPTKYAFWGAAISPAPFVNLTHRCVLVQFLQGGELKNLLFNPTDVEGARTAPYFAKLIERFKAVEPYLSKRFLPLEAQLADIGVTPEDIDYVAFDHFHVQDLRTLLGTTDGTHRPRFPHATLLAPKNEWDDWDDLHPLQQAFFVRDGKRGVRTEKVLFLHGDVALGDGVMLLRSPGHTSGNQTLFLNSDNGVWGISENGTCADSWSPVESRMPGLSGVAKHHGIDIMLNSNTPEGLADQYTAMVMERTIVDRVKHAPAFVQMFSSSEVTPSALAPGLSPTILHKAITSGTVARPSARRGSRDELRASM